MSEHLLRLALDAMTDPDALEVFADAVLEARWFDERPPRLIVPRALPMIGGWQRQYAAGAKVDRHSPDWRDWPRACAAVLLFGDWSTRPWLCAVDSMTSIRRAFASQMYSMNTTGPVMPRRGLLADVWEREEAGMVDKIRRRGHGGIL